MVYTTPKESVDKAAPAPRGFGVPLTLTSGKEGRRRCTTTRTPLFSGPPLADRDLNRAVVRAFRDGMSESQIGAIVGTHTETAIRRIIRACSEDPAILAESPAKVIDERAAGFIGDAAMMDRLLNWPYSFGHTVTIDGVTTDAYAGGDWDEVEQAYYCGHLTDAEFVRLAEQNKAHLDRATRP